MIKKIFVVILGNPFYTSRVTCSIIWSWKHIQKPLLSYSIKTKTIHKEYELVRLTCQFSPYSTPILGGSSIIEMRVELALYSTLWRSKFIHNILLFEKPWSEGVTDQASFRLSHWCTFTLERPFLLPTFRTLIFPPSNSHLNVFFSPVTFAK